MVPEVLRIALIVTALALPASLAAESPGPGAPPELHYVPPHDIADHTTARTDAGLAVFTPTTDPIRHTIDYEIWDYALKRLVLSMGPANRKGAPTTLPLSNTRLKQGPQSRYRLEGSLVLFNFLDKEVIASFTEYRQDLERVANTLDIASLPRNEQLAFWFNLHNVALLEQIALAWPVREPREIMIEGVPLDEARFITLRGIPVSLRDIREEIVFRHWRNPKVIYGFWRGEIGGPELQRHAFTGANVASLLDVAAADFVNSLRGTQRLGQKLAVSQLYADVAPFYFADFERDLRAHLAQYAEPAVADLLRATSGVTAIVHESEIADLHGGKRPPNYLNVVSRPSCWDRLGQGACAALRERAWKLQRMIQTEQPVGRVFFSNIDLPGDPPNKNAVE